jgi:hypothetical protein
MTTTPENNPATRRSSELPMLQINRLNHVRLNAKILDATDQKLRKYLQFATEQMATEITNDDVVEYALNLLFDRDSSFKSWIKQKV